MTRSRLMNRLLPIAVALACAAPLFYTPTLSAKPQGKAQEPQPVEDAALHEIVESRINAAFDQLQQDGDFDAAKASLTTLFDQMIRYVPDDQLTVYRDSDIALRLVSQLAKADASKRLGVLKYLRANLELARTLALLVKPADHPGAAYTLLSRLIEQRGKALERYAALTAAICVVHDEPLIRQINENEVVAPDPVAIFDFFVAGEKRMLFGLRDMPAELLVYVVDSTAAIDEMNWALKRYAGDKNVGDHFFDIDYDNAHFKRGVPKKVTVAGFNLPNILQYGGVCADQAYFAMSIGKAIGVPTTYTTGRSGESGHAWVGFLQGNGKQAAWNFNSGRYEAFQGVKGVVTDPQTGKPVADSTISLLAGLSMTPVEARRDAVALADAAEWILRIQKEKSALYSSPIVEGGLAIRSPDDSAALGLLESAVKRSACYSPAWFAVGRLAEEGSLSLDDKRKWAEALERLCGDRYPDFFLAVLAPMIRTVPDAQEQDRLWEAALVHFEHRFDLAAEVRFEQGTLWEKENQPDRAGKYYEDVIDRYANAGPFVLKALIRAEELLRASNRQQEIPVLYEKAWSKTTKPHSRSAVFYQQSNWYRIGTLLVVRLRDAGMQRQVTEVQTELLRLEAGK